MWCHRRKDPDERFKPESVSTDRKTALLLQKFQRSHSGLTGLWAMMGTCLCSSVISGCSWDPQNNIPLKENFYSVSHQKKPTQKIQAAIFNNSLCYIILHTVGINSGIALNFTVWFNLTALIFWWSCFQWKGPDHPTAAADRLATSWWRAEHLVA